MNNISNEALLVWLFLFSSKDKAKHWIDTRINIITWDQMQNKFLKKFLSIGKVIALRLTTTTFSQNKNEQLHKSCKRFKELLRSYPQHEVPMWQLIQSFCFGLDKHTREMVDASYGDIFLYKTPEEA